MGEQLHHNSTGSTFASSASAALSKQVPASITLGHQRLLDTDGESIHVFLLKYYQYSNESLSRSHELATHISNTEPVRPIDLNFCVYVDFLESTIALRFIDGISSYN